MFLESIEDIQQTVRVSNTLNNYDFIVNKKQTVLFKYIYGYLTTEFLEQVEEYQYDDTPYKKTLFELLNKAIIKCAVYESIAELEVTISDVGLTRQESNTDKTAYSGQVARLENSLLEEAYTLLDAFFSICYEQSVAGFDTCPIALANETFIFKSAAEFSKRVRLHRQYITYYQLQPNLLFVHENHLFGRFPQAVIDLILTGTDVQHARAKSYLLNGITYLTLHDAMMKGLVQLTSEGVKFVGSENADSNSNALQSSDNQLSAQLKYYQSTGKQQLEMVSFIIKTYPTIFGLVETEQTTQNTFFA